VPLSSLMQLDVSSVENYDEAQQQHAHAATAAASAAASAAAAGDDDEVEDDYSGGGGKGKGKRPARKRSKLLSMGPASAAAVAAANGQKGKANGDKDDDDDDDDGGGKMSPEELQQEATTSTSTSQQQAAAAAAAAADPSSSSSSAAAGAYTYTGAISLPPVAFAPTADEDELRALPAPHHPVPRDHRLPSLDPAFLGHVLAMTRVLSAKIAALLADMTAHLQEDPLAKFVVFSQFTDSLDTLASVLADRGHGCVAISAHTAKAERQRAVSAFSTNPKIRVILVTMGTGAAGLTLTAASTVYLLEPTHSPADEAQALNRAHRIGQKRAVRCLILFCKGTVEERMLAARRRSDAFMSELQEESAALTSAGHRGGRDAEKRAHFSLASFQVLLGMDQL
jgi:hypothetical protein